MLNIIYTKPSVILDLLKGKGDKCLVQGRKVRTEVKERTWTL